MSLSALNHVMFKEETTFGTEVTPDVAYPIESEDFREEGGIIVHGPVQANQAQAIRPVAGRKTYPGTLNTFIYPEEFAWFLKCLFGTVDGGSGNGTVIEAAQVWDHVFTMSSAAALPSLSVQVNRQTEVRTWAGVRIDSLNLVISPEEEVAVAIACQAKTNATDSAESPTFPTKDPFVAVDATVKMAASKTALGQATADGDIENINLIIERNLEVKHALDGSQDPNRIEPKRFRVHGSFDKYFSGVVERDAFLARTTKALGIYLSGGIVYGAYTYDLKFEMADIRFLAAIVGTTPDDIQMVACEFEAFYDYPGDAEVIEATLRNATETYY